MNKNRKGFTIVELVIVIAVIAILAAVLIPTFASLIAKANISADTQLVKNLNTALLTEKAGGENNKTMYDALQMAKNAGYDIDTIVSKSGNNIAWDSVNDRFVLIDSDKNTFIYPTDSGANAQNIGTGDAVKYFVIYKELPEKDKQTYSIYLSKDATLANGTANVKVGFDAGENTTVTKVNYDTNDEQSVIIRTNSTNTALSIKGAKSTVKHYDKVGNVLVTEVASKSYHEFGEVQGNILLANGRVVMETGSKAAAIKVTATANDVTNGNAIVSVDNTAASTVAVVVPADVKTALEAKGGDNKITANADSVVTDANVIANMEKFAGGLGTEDSPYLIANAEQFAKIADFSVKMLNTQYSFALINDIDLSAVKFNRNYVSIAFNGTLNGNNHKIYTGNELSVLFNGTLGNTVYKDFIVSLGNKLTRVTNLQYATNETEKTTLIYDNVDLTGIKGVKYNLGGDNSAYYVDGTFCRATILAEENNQIINKSDFWTQNQYVTVSNCDVDVDFSMTGNRAAVFCGGQVYSMHIIIKDSTYSGVFYGANPGLVFANYNCCDEDSLLGSIELNNIKLIGKLICLNANSQHGLTFANNNKELANVEGLNNLVECAVDSSMNISLKNDSEYAIVAASDAQIDNYVVQLNLGKLYWYDNNGNVTDIEASNYTFSIRISATDINNTGIYKVASLSSKQATTKKIDTSKLDWKDSENNVKYAFATIGEEKFLVLDIAGDFADESRLNAANVIGYIGDMPKYYKSTK